jgi:hypothetical protein
MYNKTIVGVMLVSQNSELLDITIPNLLKWCDWIMVVMDNQTLEVEEKVYTYQKQNYDKMFVRRTSMPSKFFARAGKDLTYHERWKSAKGEIRDEVFINLRRILSWKKSGYDKIDILLWPDHDEIFTDYLPQLLDKFVKSHYKAITMKPVDVVGAMDTIRKDSMGHHCHIFKYSLDLAGLPRRFHAMYHPLCHSDLMEATYYSVHLAYMTASGRKWRRVNWKNDKVDNDRLYKLVVDVNHMTPEEITNILKT